MFFCLLFIHLLSLFFFFSIIFSLSFHIFFPLYLSFFCSFFLSHLSLFRCFFLCFFLSLFLCFFLTLFLTFSLSFFRSSFLASFLLSFYFFQTSFRFAGALKFEECVRALNAIFTRHSSIPIRGKFSRLREIMMVLTADVTNSQGNLQPDNFSLLSSNEVLAFVSLRADKES